MPIPDPQIACRDLAQFRLCHLDGVIEGHADQTDTTRRGVNRLSSADLAALSLAAFDQMMAVTPGFLARAGQRDMAQRIASALAGVSLGDEP